MIILDRFVRAMVEEKIDLHTIECLPFGVSVAFREAIREVRHLVGTSIEGSKGT